MVDQKSDFGFWSTMLSPLRITKNIQHLFYGAIFSSEFPILPIWKI